MSKSIKYTQMQYTIKAKPTLYKGIEFRSRLEARWASFFDLLGWGWEYEPCDFDGWYPDFVIFGNGCDGADGRVFVEVKPVLDFPLDVAKRIVHSLPKSFNSELLILGQRPLGVSQKSYFEDSSYLGWLHSYDGLDELGNPIFNESCFEGACFGMWKGSGKLGFSGDVGSYHDRISGCRYECPNGDLAFNVELIDQLWGEAHKTVRFEPKRKASK